MTAATEPGSAGPPRVVFVVLDAFPHAALDPDRTPTLHRLAVEGGRAPDGGVADMTAATYPNHAGFVTGRSTVDHGIMVNRVLVDDHWVPAAQVGPAVPTLFDACRAEGRSSAFVVGDQYLVGTCGADAAEVHWPPGGVIPDGARRHPGGYLADDEVVGAVAELEATSAEFLMVQLDEVDGARHLHGPWSAEAVEQCRATDGALGRLVDQLAPRWSETVLIVVSDHDQEEIGGPEPVDLRDRVPDGVRVFHQGTAALVVGPMDPADVAGLPGVTGTTTLAPDHRMVWGAPGQLFGRDHGLRGEHGSPRTATQLAVVAGGHGAVGPLARWLERSRPPARVWADRIADLLDLTWRPDRATGADSPVNTVHPTDTVNPANPADPRGPT